MWPAPKHCEEGKEVVWLAPEVTLNLEDIDEARLQSEWGNECPQSSPEEVQHAVSLTPAANVITAAFERARTAIFEEHFIPDKFYPQNSDWEIEPSDPRARIETITIRCSQDPKAETKGTAAESYVLDVTSTGTVTILAASYRGAIYGLETLRQLFFTHTDPKIKDVYMKNAPLKIKDQPAFAHRGINLDICRNRIFPSDVIRTLNAMASCKLNRLHIHATDSQSWPLDIPSMPELATKGAYHPSHIWTAQLLKEVQDHGAARAIDVYIEIDMPGHTGSIYHSHPGLTVAYTEKWDEYAVEPPAGQLKLAHPDVAPFMARLLDDLLPRLAPYSTIFHVGGDELDVRAYALEEGLETTDRDKLKPYLQKFYEGVFAKIASQNLTPFAWEEALLVWELDLPKNTIVQAWRGHASLAAITARGHRALFGSADRWYLDTGLGGFLDPDPRRAGPPAVEEPFHDWKPPFKNWKLVLNFDPLEGLPAPQRALVAGGEAHLWGELTDSVNLDAMLWPRAAAAAEVLWRGKGKVGEEATRRLAAWRERAVLAGVRSSMVQMEWCLRNKGTGVL